MVVDDVGSGIGAHAAGVGTGVAIAGTFVVLGCDQWRHALAVADDEKRKFVALKALFEYNTRTCFAQHPAAEHFSRHPCGFLFTVGDDHALARGQSIGLYHHRGMKVSQSIAHLRT